MVYDYALKEEFSAFIKAAKLSVSLNRYERMIIFWIIISELNFKEVFAPTANVYIGVGYYSGTRLSL